MAEVALFFRQLFTKPKQVSAIAPSSRWLARAMARDLGPQTGRVVEFGPGTGVLTRGILAAGVAQKDLTLFEMNPEFVTHLRAQFPGATVHQAGAQTAADLVDAGVGAVVSGLPLLSMPLELREAIVKAAFDILAPGGVYIQFTYGAKPALSPEQLARMGLVADSGVRVWANMPPANVFRFRRAG
jgi:phosphatidylethanolamine/phosphatidyl-N-methylethanolamine N-methyltransferase